MEVPWSGLTCVCQEQTAWRAVTSSNPVTASSFLTRCYRQEARICPPTVGGGWRGTTAGLPSRLGSGGSPPGLLPTAQFLGATWHGHGGRDPAGDGSVRLLSPRGPP